MCDNESAKEVVRKMMHLSLKSTKAEEFAREDVLPSVRNLDDPAMDWFFCSSTNSSDAMNNLAMVLRWLRIKYIYIYIGRKK
jgi:hypothetical protein